MRAEVFALKHIDALADHGGQEYLVTAMAPEDVARLTAKGTHLSFFAGDVLIGCAGVVPVHEWRGVSWALIRSGLPEHFLGFHRGVLAALRAEAYQRVEAYVDPTMSTAERWMRALGFRIETPYKPFYFPDGRGASEWVRYKT